MPKNFVQPGGVVTVTAPRNAASGDILKVGQILGVAVGDAVNGQPAEIRIDGVWRIEKNPNLAIAAGAALFWNNTSFQVETTPTTTFTYLGAALEAAATADTEVVAILGYRPSSAFSA